MDSITVEKEIVNADGWVEIPLNEQGRSDRTILQVENVSIDDIRYRLGATSTAKTGHTFEKDLFLRCDQTIFVRVPDDVVGRGVTLVITRSS